MKLGALSSKWSIFHKIRRALSIQSRIPELSKQCQMVQKCSCKVSGNPESANFPKGKPFLVANFRKFGYTYILFPEQFQKIRFHSPREIPEIQTGLKKLAPGTFRTTCPWHPLQKLPNFGRMESAQGHELWHDKDLNLFNVAFHHPPSCALTVLANCMQGLAC